MSHLYHPHCGCDICCKYEDVLERDDEELKEFSNKILECQSFLEEVSLSEEDLPAVIQAIKDNDMAALGTAFLGSAKAYLADLIQQLQERSGEEFSGRAASHLYTLYKE